MRWTDWLRRALGLGVVVCISVAISADAVHGASDLSQQKRMWRKNGEVIWARSPAEKVVALTFDDGPNPTYTQAIVDELDKHGAKATFFVIGSRAVKHPDLVKHVAQHGHELGLHGYAHGNMARWDEAHVDDDLQQAEDSLQALGIKSHLFRPPLGEISPTMVNVARRRGYQVVMWSWTQDTRDWSRPRAGSIARHVLKNVRTGDIILLHDGTGNRRNTLQALSAILEGLHKDGYRAVTVSELLRLPEQPGVRQYPRRGP